MVVNQEEHQWGQLVNGIESLGLTKRTPARPRRILTHLKGFKQLSEFAKVASCLHPFSVKNVRTDLKNLAQTILHSGQGS